MIILRRIIHHLNRIIKAHLPILHDLALQALPNTINHSPCPLAHLAPPDPAAAILNLHLGLLVPRGVQESRLESQAVSIQVLRPVLLLNRMILCLLLLRGRLRMPRSF